MAFRVRFEKMTVQDYPDDARFEINNGVLGIHYSDTAKWSEYYAPHAWQQVTSPQAIPEVWGFVG
ncbi:hypothetical protein PP299_07395 [Mycobacteroides abscessus]|nr:hypothetical protein [Mycobacteroides abscessus]MDM1905309.1 hypothetical protein [Mycobacteroides abscessus]MDM1910839.1 hypothetical protein [Mycobacteroides abscessus]MDM1919890.1 hypothetical protein [Mycobacteroides abscessus]